MTSGGTCYHCGEWVTCMPPGVREALREFGDTTFSSTTVREGRWNPATRRWSCTRCAPRAFAPVPMAAPFEPDLEHQKRELFVLRLRPAPDFSAENEKARASLAELKDLRRASQPWRRR